MRQTPEPPERNTTDQQAPESRGIARTFQALAYRDFRLLFLAQVAYAGGLWIWMIGLPLLVLHLTPSPVHLGAVMAVRTVPSVVFGLFAGVLADQFNRRLVLMGAQAIGFINGLLMAIVILGGWIELWHVYAFSFMRGVSMAFDQPARRAVIPSVLPEHLVTNGMALQMGSVQTMRIVGAAGAGILVATLGMGPTFLASAVLFGLSVALVGLAVIPDYERTGYQGPKMMLMDFVEGFRFAWQSPAIRGALIVGMVFFTFGASFTMVFAPLLAKETLGIGDSGFGYMMSFMGVGGGVGALALATANPNRRRGLMLMGAIAIFGGLLALFSASTYVAWMPLVFFVVILLGIGQSAIFPLINAVLLNSAPLEMRGRIMGLLSLDRAMISLGSVVAGFLAAATDAQIGQIIFGVACVLTAAVLFVFYRPLRRVD